MFQILIGVLLAGLSFAEEGKPAMAKAQERSWEDFYWEGEICVLYDYRIAIRKNQDLSPNIFAIEVKNQNGGSLERTYPLPKDKKLKSKEFKRQIRAQFLKASKDIQKMIEKGRCDRMEIFYPDKNKIESEM